MAIPQPWTQRLRLPALSAPMFLTSGVDLVVEVCRAGVVGTFPSLNARTTDDYHAWLNEIKQRLASHADAAPFGVNLIVHKSNQRLNADLDMTVAHQVPLVITSLGAVRDVVDAVHGYGGLVFHDVINRRHAEKAAEAGVDGIIAVSAGAGGHAGTLSPFALINEIKSVFSGTIVLSGAISSGRQIAAVRMMGADLAYLGTRFLATQEAMVAQPYKDMVAASTAADVIYTPNISGIAANFLRPSIVAAGLDPDNLPPVDHLDLETEAKAWKTIWSAGQGVGAISDVPKAADLCARLIREYQQALQDMSHDPFCRTQDVEADG